MLEKKGVRCPSLCSLGSPFTPVRHDRMKMKTTMQTLQIVAKIETVTMDLFRILPATFHPTLDKRI